VIIDHIGIVVRSIEKGIEHWQGVFEYQKMTEVVVNSRQKVKVVFLSWLSLPMNPPQFIILP